MVNLDLKSLYQSTGMSFWLYVFVFVNERFPFGLGMGLGFKKRWLYLAVREKSTKTAPKYSKCDIMKYITRSLGVHKVSNFSKG